jgi:hypothetical protein
MKRNVVACRVADEPVGARPDAHASETLTTILDQTHADCGDDPLPRRTRLPVSSPDPLPADAPTIAHPLNRINLGVDGDLTVSTGPFISVVGAAWDDLTA